jgi:peptidoglycan/LPS O-acetylase OafA/YrhL
MFFAEVIRRLCRAWSWQLRHRYVYLDGLRGLAAISVMLFHNGAALFFINRVAPRAYLAVDFFFLMSGFVLAAAYDGRLAAGQVSFRRFMGLRFARLYPMIFAGTMLGATVALGKMSMTGALHAGSVGWACLMGLSLLPLPSSLLNGFIFPLDGPLWSLFYELVANTAYGGAARYLGSFALALIVSLGATATVIAASIHGAFNLGSNPGALAAVAATGRVCFSFFGGIILFRAFDRLGRFTISPSICTIVLVFIFAAPVLLGHWYLDAVCVGFVFPVILLAGARATVTGGAAKICNFLGEISYPLYAIHYPILRIFLYIQEKYQLESLRLAVGLAVEVLVAIVTAYIALKIYDEPARRYLGSVMLQPKAAGQISVLQT